MRSGLHFQNVKREPWSGALLSLLLWFGLWDVNNENISSDLILNNQRNVLVHKYIHKLHQNIWCSTANFDKTATDFFAEGPETIAQTITAQ